MRYVLVLLIILTSCEVTKKASKVKRDTDFTEEIKTQTVRKGDTVTFVVPKVVLKDTTIYTKNRVGSTIKTRYDSSGVIDKIDCLTSNIDILREENRQLKEFYKNKDNEKEKKVDDSALLIAIISVGLVIILALIVIGKFMSNQTNLLKSMLSK